MQDLSSQRPEGPSFLRAALISGTAFAVLWGPIMWFLTWREDAMPIALAVGVSVLTGVLFGVAMAYVARWKANKAIDHSGSGR